MVVAIPPEPVAAFGDQKIFAGLGCGRGVHVLRFVRSVERRPCGGPLTPRRLIVSVPDPDVEVRVDPRAGEDAGQLRTAGAGSLGHGHGPQLGVVGQAAVQRAQERPAASGEVFPGVLAVQNDRDHGLSPAGAIAIPRAGIGQVTDEVVGRGLRVPARIDEADQVRQHMVRGRDSRPRRRRRGHGTACRGAQAARFALRRSAESRRRASGRESSRPSPSSGIPRGRPAAPWRLKPSPQMATTQPGVDQTTAHDNPRRGRAGRPHPQAAEIACAAAACLDACACRSRSRTAAAESGGRTATPKSLSGRAPRRIGTPESPDSAAPVRRSAALLCRLPRIRGSCRGAPAPSGLRRDTTDRSRPACARPAGRADRRG